MFSSLAVIVPSESGQRNFNDGPHSIKNNPPVFGCINMIYNIKTKKGYSVSYLTSMTTC
jgi:hypothetical protein